MNWIPILLLLSFVFLLFNGGAIIIAVMWAMYLKYRLEKLGPNPREIDIDLFAKEMVIGIIVVVLSLAIKLFAFFVY